MPRRTGADWSRRFDRYARKTFDDATDKYLNEYQGKAPRRLAYAVKALRPYIGKLPLMDVNNDALTQFKDDRLNGKGSFSKPASSGTVNLELTLVSTILKCACEEWEWIPRKLKIRHVRGPSKVAYPLTWDEQDALFAKLPQHWSEGLALFAVNTGVRPNELLRLQWADLVEIPGLDGFVFILDETKNGEARAVVCNSLARLAVERQRGNKSPYVFPSRAVGRRGDQLQSLGRYWYPAWKAAGLPAGKWSKQGPHNLRHTFAQRLRAAGVSQEDRNTLLGHARANLAEHYAMPDLERLFAKAELVTDRSGGFILRRQNAA